MKELIDANNSKEKEEKNGTPVICNLHSMRKNPSCF